MTHDEAIKDSATERYVLKQMTDEESDAFEKHYFDCPVCAEDVIAAIAIRDEGLALVEKPPVETPVIVPFPQRQRTLPAWLASAAAVVVSVLTMGFGVVGPLQTKLAESRHPTTPLVHVFSELRGEGPAVADKEGTVVVGSKPNILSVVIDPDDEAPQYTWSIIDAQNHPRATQVVPADQVIDLALPVIIPAKTLEPGKYQLRVLSKRVVNHSFTVR